MSKGDFLANNLRAHLFLFALFSLVIASCGPNEAEVEATLTAAAPTSLPTSTTGSTAIQEWECRRINPFFEVEIVNLYGSEEVQVTAFQSFVIYIGWIADSEKLVDDYLQSIDIQVYVDGRRVTNTVGMWGEIEQYVDIDNDGDVDYLANWVCLLGELSPGTYIITANVVYGFSITDGLDSDGDGVEDQFSGTDNLLVTVIAQAETDTSLTIAHPGPDPVLLLHDSNGAR